MTKDKDFKRLVRRRMQKTGESYTTARSHLLSDDAPTAGVRASTSETAPPAEAGASLPEDYEALAGMSDEAVRAATGKDWSGWTRELDALGATSMAHRDIAGHLREQGTAPWWSQMVTVGYERLRGLRDVGQSRGGSYQLTRSRTLPVGVGELYRAWLDDAIRGRWLDRPDFTVGTAREGRSLRVAFDDGTRLDVAFTAKGDSKSTVTVEHRKLPDRERAEELKAFWSERLDALAALLADG